MQIRCFAIEALSFGRRGFPQNIAQGQQNRRKSRITRLIPENLCCRTQGNGRVVPQPAQAVTLPRSPQQIGHHDRIFRLNLESNSLLAEWDRTAILPQFHQHAEHQVLKEHWLS